MTWHSKNGRYSIIGQNLYLNTTAQGSEVSICMTRPTLSALEQVLLNILLEIVGQR